MFSNKDALHSWRCEMRKAESFDSAYNEPVILNLPVFITNGFKFG